MANESSFDIVSRVDIPEVKNSVNQAMGEIRQRYDFKGSKSSIALDEKSANIIIISDNDFKLKSVVDILQSKFVKRNVPLKNMNYGQIEKASGGTVRQEITLQQGIPMEKAREIVKLIKERKLKVQGSIQQDQVRVVGKKKDDLQQVIQTIKGKDMGIDLQFVNFR